MEIPLGDIIVILSPILTFKSIDKLLPIEIVFVLKLYKDPSKIPLLITLIFDISCCLYPLTRIPFVVSFLINIPSPLIENIVSDKFEKFDALLDLLIKCEAISICTPASSHYKVAEVDLRVPTPELVDGVCQEILGRRAYDPDVTLEVIGGMNRPPYEKDAGIAALYEHARGLAAEIGFELRDTKTGGGSDGKEAARPFDYWETVDGDGGWAARVTNVRDLTLAELRTHVGMAFEDATLFSQTVRENVLLGREDLEPGSEEAERILREALQVAQAHFVDDLPNGVDTVIGEEGLSLSGGQRQRLALARAVAARPSILVLDDPLSALDVDTEALVEDALREVLHDTTAMIVAHRPSTVMLADRVALLEAGKVTAVGAHSDLLRESAHYRHVISSLEDDEARARETEVNL